MRWWCKAAEQGDLQAGHKVGIGYELGQGVAQDYVEAYAWYDFAGRFYVAAVNDRVALEKKMSPQQLRDGQQRAWQLWFQPAARLKIGGK